MQVERDEPDEAPPSGSEAPRLFMVLACQLAARNNYSLEDALKRMGDKCLEWIPVEGNA